MIDFYRNTNTSFGGSVFGGGSQTTAGSWNGATRSQKGEISSFTLKETSNGWGTSYLHERDCSTAELENYGYGLGDAFE